MPLYQSGWTARLGAALGQPSASREGHECHHGHKEDSSEFIHNDGLERRQRL